MTTELCEAIARMDAALRRLVGEPAPRQRVKPPVNLAPEGAEIFWLTTPAGDSRKTCGEDGGQRGWRVHAVLALSIESQLVGRRALCGLAPLRGWGTDLFVNEPCVRCVAAALRRGIALPQPPKDVASDPDLDFVGLVADAQARAALRRSNRGVE